jgi:ribosomal protein S18 acetylase RimI-like enzyme
MTAPKPDLAVEKVERMKSGDLGDLCDATVLAIGAEGGFGWVVPPTREVLERYWKGVLIVPERTLLVGRLDGVIGGSAQLVRAPRNNEAQARAIQLTTAFMAPWARGHGLARMLWRAAEDEARSLGAEVINLDVRETQEAAIQLCETLGYTCWGTHPHYAKVDGKTVAGRYYYKQLTVPAAESGESPV